MTMRAFRLVVALAGLIPALLPRPADAASLRVAPVLIDMTAPDAASSIHVWNDGDQPINVQVRIFRWSQKDGVDVLEPARDVAISPPITSLAPHGETLVRVVRTSPAPVAGQESYRLIVDELPDPARARNGAITLVLRHSIPVFFTDPSTAASALAWSAERSAGGFVVTAHNAGGRRLRVTNLVLSAPGGRLGGKDGLVGYVLGGATAHWFVPASDTRGAGPLTITADSEAGRFNAVAHRSGD